LKGWAKKAFHLRALLNVPMRELSMLQDTYFISVESMPGKCRKVVFSSLSTVFGLTHFAIQFVAYTSSTRCWVSCWQQQLGCEWNAKPQNVRHMFKSTEPADFWQCSCTTSILLFSWVVRTKFQISSNKFYIFTFMV